MKINIGCGPYKAEGYIGIDKDPACKPDILHDINTGLDFKDSTIDEIYASHILEHVDDLIFVMNECWRVLVDGGVFEINVPNGNYLEYAMIDPTHKRMFFKDTFLYFSTSAGDKYPAYSEIKCRFNIKSIVEEDKALKVILVK